MADVPLSMCHTIVVSAAGACDAERGSGGAGRRQDAAAAGGRHSARRGGHRQERQPEGHYEGGAGRTAADAGGDAASLAAAGGRGSDGGGLAAWQVSRDGMPAPASGASRLSRRQTTSTGSWALADALSRPCTADRTRTLLSMPKAVTCSAGRDERARRQRLRKQTRRTPLHVAASPARPLTRSQLLLRSLTARTVSACFQFAGMAVRDVIRCTVCMPSVAGQFKRLRQHAMSSETGSVQLAQPHTYAD